MQSKTVNDPVIFAEQLTRVYPLGGAGVTALDGVDLAVSPGEMIALKGDSGSGKSTLLSLLAGLDRPTAGRLAVAGFDMKTISERDLNGFRCGIVGMVFQTFNLLPTLNALENVTLPAFLAGKAPKDILPKARELLGWLGLDGRIDHFPGQLSGGEMQRVAIARALINDPAVILADEPTGNLDSDNGRVVIELLAELNQKQGRTLIIATHSNIADPFVTRQICLKDGRITDSQCDL